MDRHAHAAGTRRALTQGAFALPGLAALSAVSSLSALTPGEASADAPAQETTARYAFSFYKEDNLSPGKFVNATGTGSRERYEIYAHQFSLLTPLTTPDGQRMLIDAAGLERLHAVASREHGDVRILPQLHKVLSIP